MEATNFQNTAEQAAAFQKIWTDSFAKMIEAGFTTIPNSPPPEMLRQIRSGIFQALAQSWEEFMRSPQFLDSMRQWMEQAVSFRKQTNDFMARMRNEMQAPSREDVDTIMLNVRHIEKRLLDRIEELSAQISALNRNSKNGPVQKRAAPATAAKTKAPRAGAKARTPP